LSDRLYEIFRKKKAGQPAKNGDLPPGLQVAFSTLDQLLTFIHAYLCPYCNENKEDT
jgi:hypothetical protein